MTRFLLIVWIAMIGADRIDFLAGGGIVVLKPLLVLSPPILYMEATRLLRASRRLVIPPATALFFVLLSGFLGILFVSVMVNVETESSLGRLALICAEAYAVFLIVLCLVNREDLRDIVVKGSVVGLIMAMVFDTIQILRWAGIHDFAWAELGGVVNLAPATYGPWLPRPSATSIDPNRGGMLVLLYLVLLRQWATASASRSVLRVFGWLAIILTLSRSAILAAIVTATVTALQGMVRLSRTALATTALIGALGAGVLMASGPARATVAAAGEILSGRFSLDEGSAGQHGSLLERAWEVSAREPSNFLLGIGFGNSFLELQDFFPGTKYANFHSLYLTVLAEAGVFALILLLLLLLYPLVHRGGLQAYVAGLLMFNVFYQMHTDAVFWLGLSAAWMNLPELLDKKRLNAPTGAEGSLAPRTPDPVAA